MFRETRRRKRAVGDHHMDLLDEVFVADLDLWTRHPLGGNSSGAPVIDGGSRCAGDGARPSMRDLHFGAYCGRFCRGVSSPLFGHLLRDLDLPSRPRSPGSARRSCRCPGAFGPPWWNPRSFERFLAGVEELVSLDSQTVGFDINPPSSPPRISRPGEIQDRSTKARAFPSVVGFSVMRVPHSRSGPRA